ncbi:hypothetical protein [Pseudomonas frederiksbergensis]|uniref:hypothetical protein n=1 Tax=Pseudomonas frederiksbergensis TaxID=104087 RepID=UPI000F47D2B5|nr:hypothetical protein [Pseudomonas frederiksbergensis]RON45367.1 hypothetical protein BK667_24880 [Pseudomonas frederiksbergensis]
MTPREIVIPKQNSIQAAGNTFCWSLGGNRIHAQHSFFCRMQSVPGRWVFSGLTGSPDQDNYFSVDFNVPALGDDVLERTYQLGDGQGLRVTHTYSLPGPDGVSVIEVIDADYAELTIRLDPIKRTVRGDFNAHFKSVGLKPEGAFQLKTE